jgi:hypothetical protein
MANPEHLKILKQGVEVWNDWRKHNPLIVPELSEAVLSGSKLSDANFRMANLWRASLEKGDLNGGDFDGANLFQANLKEANLAAASFQDANLEWADLSGAFLYKAIFWNASLRHACLNRADLTAADLGGANLAGAQLEFANLAGAGLTNSILADNDLSMTSGLDEVEHGGPVTIGIDTFFRSRGKIPEVFLRGCGVPEILIQHLPLFVGQPIEFYSCFISYSTKDEIFAKRLHTRMREANMRVWFAPEDLKGGKKLHEQLFEAIQIHDRLLIVLSEHSIQSDWVMTEIRKARETEKKDKRRKLFPIRLTDFETLRDWTCFDADTGKDLAVEVREYFIPDFSNWKVLADGHHAAFESAFARLKKDLEAENSKKS